MTEWLFTIAKEKPKWSVSPEIIESRRTRIFEEINLLNLQIKSLMDKKNHLRAEQHYAVSIVDNSLNDLHKKVRVLQDELETISGITNWN